MKNPGRGSDEVGWLVVGNWDVPQQNLQRRHAQKRRSEGKQREMAETTASLDPTDTGPPGRTPLFVRAAGAGAERPQDAAGAGVGELAMSPTGILDSYGRPSCDSDAVAEHPLLGHVTGENADASITGAETPYAGIAMEDGDEEEQVGGNDGGMLCTIQTTTLS